MTAIKYVTPREMEAGTGFPKALGYAFPEEKEIWLLKGMRPEVEHEVRRHEAEHIERGEEGPFWDIVAGVGASILGGILGSRGASDAADAEVAASRENIAFQRENRDLALAYNAPFRNAGYTALAAMMDMTGLPRGAPSAPGAAPRAGGAAQPINTAGLSGMALTLANARNQQIAQQQGTPGNDIPALGDFPEYDWKQDPGYEFRLDESMRALERGGAARGGLLSGGFAKKALRYAQEYASNEYQNVYNRLMNIVQPGSAATAAGGSAINTASAYGGQAIMNAGSARASGYVGQANAWADTINQIGQLDWDSFAAGG